MLQLSEVMKAAAEAGRAVNEVGAFTGKARSEFPDLFRKSSSVEGFKDIENSNPARTEYPSMFAKSETANIKYNDYGKAHRNGDELLPNNDYSITATSTAPMSWAECHSLRVICTLRLMKEECR